MHQYLIEITDIDTLWFTSPDTIMQISSIRSDNTLFLLNICSIDSAYIRSDCERCEDKISVAIVGVDESAYTDVFYLNHQESISLKEAFERYPGKNFLSSLFDSWEEIWIDFRTNLMGGVQKARRMTPAPKSQDANPATPKLAFLETEGIYFSEIEDVSIGIEVLPSYPIQAIFLSEVGKAILCVGDTSILSEYVSISDSAIPPMGSFLPEAVQKEETISYNISYEQLAPYLKRPLTLGGSYQLNIILEGDLYRRKGIYWFSFHLVSLEEKETILNFLKSSPDR